MTAAPQPQQQPANTATPQQVVGQMIHTHLLAMIEGIDRLAWQAERDGTPLSSAEQAALLERKNQVLTWMGESEAH